MVGRKELLPLVDELAAKIASFEPEAVRRAKEAVWRGMDLSLRDGLDLE
jgi:enoyl-CoA hydratase/carnithine racemase